MADHERWPAAATQVHESIGADDTLQCPCNPLELTRMSETAHEPELIEDDNPSLDPLAIERAYRRERARRRARVERQSAARRSDVRFWVTLLVLAFFAAFVIMAAWHEVGTLFGV